MKALAGKAIAITGAGNGLGREYAIAVANSGANVVVNDADPAATAAVVDEIVASGGSAIGVATSVSSWEGAESIVASTIASFGAIDGLVNNAGVFHDCVAVDETAESLSEIVSVNLLGALYCGTFALRAMVRQGSGVILNATSGAHLGTARLSAYGATKGGIASATYAWAVETRNSGVRVNAIAPYAHTAMTQGWERPTIARPADVAPVVVYLLSDRALDVTGLVLRVDASGVCALLAPRLQAGIVPLNDTSVEGIDNALRAHGLIVAPPSGFSSEQVQ